MSIVSEINRIKVSKEDIKNAIITRGGTIPGDSIGYYAQGVLSIPLSAPVREILDTDPLSFVCVYEYDEGNSSVGMVEVGNTGYNTDNYTQYKKNDGNWQSYKTGDLIPMSYGDKVSFRGTSSNLLYTKDNDNYRKFVTKGFFKCGGDISSLTNFDKSAKNYKLTHMFDGSNIVSAPNITYDSLENGGNYEFMFQDCKYLVTPPKISTTKFPWYAMNSMFYRCKSLKSAPYLPATELSERCYQFMFYECESLTDVPTLPSTSLAKGCYYYMFNRCYSLRIGPYLPAKYLTEMCYEGMFSGSYNLNYLHADTLYQPSTYYSKDWFWDVASSGTFVAGSGATWTTSISRGTSTVPSGWNITQNSFNESDYCKFTEVSSTGDTLQVWYTVPSGSKYGTILYTDGDTEEKTLQPNEKITCNKGYIYLRNIGGVDVEGNTITFATNKEFKIDRGNITNLNKASQNKAYKYSSMFKGSKIVSVEDSCFPAEPTTDYCYEYMFQNCKSLTKAPKISQTSLSPYCCNYMFSGCTSLTKAPELPATTLATYCYQYMFSGCTSLTTATELPATTLASGCYYNMFRGCTSLTTAPELPATTLAGGCYNNMFYGCSSLTTAPELPATTLVTNCYNNMFYSCSGLTTAPILPATTLASGCYNNMFRGCKSLTTAPELPATKLVTNCYRYMFSGCTQLNYVKALFTTTPSTSYTDNWLSGVASSGTFVAGNDATWTTSISRGESTVPTGWTIKVEPEETPFTIKNVGDTAGVVSITYSGNETPTKVIKYRINNGGWNNLVYNENITLPVDSKMQLSSDDSQLSSSGRNIKLLLNNSLFDVEGNLNSLIDYREEIKPYEFRQFMMGSSVRNAGDLIMPTTVADNCYSNMFNGCSSLTNAPSILPATTLSSNCYSSMFSGCISLTNAPELPATTLASNCYQYMFSNCRSLTNAPELPATTLANNCYQYMFSGCRGLTTAPVLPATTLASGCYIEMFSGCAQLNYVKAMFTTTPSTSYTDGWLYVVASSGTFVKNSNATWTTTGSSGVPNGWTIEYADA